MKSARSFLAAACISLIVVALSVIAIYLWLAHRPKGSRESAPIEISNDAIPEAETEPLPESSDATEGDSLAGETPVLEAAVARSATRITGRAAYPTISAVTWTITDAQGNYRIDGVEAGQYRVQVSRRDRRIVYRLGPHRTIDVGDGETRCDLEYATNRTQVESSIEFSARRFQEPPSSSTAVVDPRSSAAPSTRRGTNGGG